MSYENYEDFDPGEPMPDGESSGTMSFIFVGPDPGPVDELYGIFRRPSNDADLKARDLAWRTGGLETGLGDIVVDGGRLAFSGLGGATDMLYVAPTTNDRIVHAVLPNGGGGAGTPGPDGLVLSVNLIPPGAVVMGLVGDTIVAVDIVVDGERREARMGENSFGLRIEDGALEGLVLHREDGTNMVLPLSAFPDLP